MTAYHDDDDILGKAYDARLMRRLLPFLRPHLGLAAAALAAVLLGTGAFLLGPWIVGRIIDEGIARGDRAAVRAYALLFLEIQLASFLLTWVRNYFLQALGQRIMFDLRGRIFSHLQKMSLSFFDRNPVGRLVTRVTGDVAALAEMFSVGLVTVVGDLFLIGGIAAAMFWCDGKLAVIALAVLPPLALLTHGFKSRLRGAYRDIRVRLARLNSCFQENIAGIRVVQLFNREDRNARRYTEISRDLLASNLRSIFLDAVFIPCVTTLSSVAVALVLWQGGGDVLAGHLPLGVLVSFISYAMHFFEPIRDITEKYNIFQAAMAGSERVFRVLDTPEEVADPPQPRPVGLLQGAVEFDRVWFAYRDGEYVLKDVSFSVRPGERIAVVGATGAGKSTLINLLCRFYDVRRGRVLIDGRDVRDFPQRDLRRNLGVVLQDVFLFSGTVADNLRLGDRQIPMERIREAAERVRADEFIRRLPGGYDAVVAERGAKFSLGERQLLAFARALVFDPRILVLDEATASVDVETERKIREALRTLVRGRTGIIIAHRLSTIEHADRILVMHHGRLAEQGTHRELMAARGLYFNFYRLQAEGARVLV
jgi:ATP-binding cassette subfamily B multidrug efflux pump